ncbi:putative dual-specificity RNA methyltransferase RlmN [Spirochaetia bacterium]|nr:putative dual-specificity RNA methyltransferase RlmN [Spirochaetia bacterium]
MIEAVFKPVLSGYPLSELQELLHPLPRFRVKQIFSWISRGVRSFAEMTDLSQSLRADLGERFSLYASEVAARLKDPDGTEKLQISLRDGCLIEAVLLTDGEERRTACLSTQAGCPQGCVFCKTGALPFRRNLDSAEIVEQFLHLRGAAADGDADANTISNIVIMGMGEPMLNLAELRRAVSVFTASEGFGLSGRRITVSTSGIAAGIRDLADNGPRVRLALSLTTADTALREHLMPVTKSNPLPEVKAALQHYQQCEGRRITLEMVLLGGLNTRREDVDALQAFIRGLDAVINLIPWNPVEGMSFAGRPLREPEPGELAAFMAELEQRGIAFTRRYRKGRTIGGACGQLGGMREPYSLTTRDRVSTSTPSPVTSTSFSRRQPPWTGS